LLTALFKTVKTNQILLQAAAHAHAKINKEMHTQVTALQILTVTSTANALSRIY
jgi:hypothetical protein